MTLVIGKLAEQYPAGPSPKPRVLYWVHVGAVCCGWWDTAPPGLNKQGKCPRFRVPDVYHDHVVGTDEQVIQTLTAGGILPTRRSYVKIDVPQEWALTGLRYVAEAKRKPRRAVSTRMMFEPQYMRPTTRDGMVS